MVEVKVGDRIRILKDDANGTNERAGAVLKVVSGDEYTFITDSSEAPGVEAWHFSGRCFEHGTIELVGDSIVEESRVKVFEQAHKPEPGQPVINTVVEFPIDPRLILAGMAMQALIAKPGYKYEDHRIQMAQEALQCADALLGAAGVK